MSEKLLQAGPVRRVLVVDGEANVLWSLAQSFRQRGFEVAVAESGEVALERLSGGCFDLVVTAAEQPGLDGFGLLKWLETYRGEIPVVMTSADSSSSRRQAALRAGALLFFEKPLDNRALLDRLEEHFRSSWFVGRVTDIDLLDYLQLISTTRKSKTIIVKHRGEVGRLDFEDGEVVHAVCGGLSGVEAFSEMMYWESGSFTDVPFEPVRERSIDERTSFLLIEAARLRDERTHEEEIGTGRTVRERDEEEDDAEEVAEQTFSGLHAQYRAFLEGICRQESVEGAILLTRQGLTLARIGTTPPGLDLALRELQQASDGVDGRLDFGGCLGGDLKLEDGTELLLRPFGGSLLGVWFSSQGLTGEVLNWIETHRDVLE